MSGDEIADRLFGSAARVLATVTVSILLVTGSAFAAGIVGVPSLERIDNEFGEVTDSHTEVRTALTVDNPNPIGVGSADVSATYTVSMNGIEMADGGSGSVALDPGVSTEQFTTHVENDRIPAWWVSHLENGEETDVVIDATVQTGVLGRSTGVTDEQTVETDLIGEFDSTETRPVNASHPLVDDPYLYVNETRASWGEIDERETELEVRFDVYNPQSYDVPVTRLQYEISMNDVVVGAGETDDERLLRSGEVTELETTAHVDNERLDDWWVTHVSNDEVTDLRIEFEAEIEVLEGSTVVLPLDSLTYEETIETDIWGNKTESDASNDAGTTRG